MIKLSDMVDLATTSVTAAGEELIIMYTIFADADNNVEDVVM